MASRPWVSGQFIKRLLLAMHSVAGVVCLVVFLQIANVMPGVHIGANFVYAKHER